MKAKNYARVKRAADLDMRRERYPDRDAALNAEIPKYLNGELVCPKLITEYLLFVRIDRRMFSETRDVVVLKFNLL